MQTKMPHLIHRDMKRLRCKCVRCVEFLCTPKQVMFAVSFLRVCKTASCLNPNVRSTKTLSVPSKCNCVCLSDSPPCSYFSLACEKTNKQKHQIGGQREKKKRHKRRMRGGELWAGNRNEKSTNMWMRAKWFRKEEGRVKRRRQQRQRRMLNVSEKGVPSLGLLKSFPELGDNLLFFSRLEIFLQFVRFRTVRMERKQSGTVCGRVKYELSWDHLNGWARQQRERETLLTIYVNSIHLKCFNPC